MFYSVNKNTTTTIKFRKTKNENLTSVVSVDNFNNTFAQKIPCREIHGSCQWYFFYHYCVLARACVTQHFNIID